VHTFSLGTARDKRERMVASLAGFVADPSNDHAKRLTASSTLEAFGRAEPTLIPIEIVEQLAQSTDFSTRSSAAHIMWDLATTSRKTQVCSSSAPS